MSDESRSILQIFKRFLKKLFVEKETGKSLEQNWNKNIQLIRGLAVTMVVISHFARVSILGDFGVDLFFIISGYLITSILASEYERSRTIDVKSFLFRRIKRLVPAAYVVILSILGLAYFDSLPGLFTDYLKLGFGYCLYIGNVFGLIPGSSTATALGLGHFWTLATEMQLYFLWSTVAIPVLLRVKNYFRIFIPVTFLLIILPIIVYVTRHISQTIVQRSIEVTAMFTLGTIFYLINLHFDFKRRPLFALLMSCLLALGPFKIIAPITDNKVIGIYFNILLVGCAYQLILKSRLASWTKPLVAVGDFSYSLYLIHWPIYLVAGGQGATLLALSCGLIASIGLSILSYQKIEKYFWKPIQK